MDIENIESDRKGVKTMAIKTMFCVWSQIMTSLSRLSAIRSISKNPIPRCDVLFLSTPLLLDFGVNRRLSGLMQSRDTSHILINLLLMIVIIFHNSYRSIIPGIQRHRFQGLRLPQLIMFLLMFIVSHKISLSAYVPSQLIFLI